MAFTIEKNIPVPTGARKSKYPFDQMEVGDSFLVAGVKRVNVNQSALKWGKENKKKFLTKQVEGGVRCWRVE